MFDGHRRTTAIAELRHVEWEKIVSQPEVVIWGNKITSNVSHPVQFHASKEVAQHILTDTKKWPQDCFDEVDWEHLDLAMSSKSNI